KRISEAFEEDERIDSAHTVLEEAPEIKLVDPAEEIEDPINEKPAYRNLKVDGVIDFGWGYLFLQAPEEYDPKTIVEIFDNGVQRLRIPLELLHIDANSEAFKDRS
ncbi:MAG: hypothetical protein ACOCZX_05490, partial [Candidatus Bipolaricaulota bacterium]